MCSEIGQKMPVFEKEFAFNLQTFLKELSEIINNANKSEITRSLAAIQLKNSVHSKDETIKIQFQERWLNINEDVRSEIKKNCFESLGIEFKRPSHSAQCFAYIACAELSKGASNDSFKNLILNVANTNSSEILKESSLEAIGYICQEINPVVLTPYTTQLFEMILECFSPEQNDNLKQLALGVLNGSKDFTKACFLENAKIIEKIISLAIDESMFDQCKLTGLKYIEKLIDLFYSSHKFDLSLIRKTLSLIKSNDFEISQQSIFIWINLIKSESKNVENNNQYVLASSDELLQSLLECLINQKDDEDEDEWTTFKASCICLILLVNFVQADLVTQFIDANISSSEWKKRDAALIASSSLLKLNDLDILKNILDEKLVEILNFLLQESNEAVRETVECLVYSICKKMPEYLQKFEKLNEFHLLKSFKFNLFCKDLFDFEIKLNKHKKYKINFKTAVNELDAKSITSNDESCTIRKIGCNKQGLDNCNYKLPILTLNELNNAIKSLRKISINDEQEANILIDNEVEKIVETRQPEKPDIHTQQAEKYNKKIFKLLDPVEKEIPPFLLVKLRHVDNNLI